MSQNKGEMRIRWPFAPETVRLNNDTTFLKIIAMFTMFCDHAGKMLFPQWPILRIVGRIAFPLFAYCTAVGCVYTHDPIRYLKRMVALALITQPIYAVALNHSVPAMYSVSFSQQPVLASIRFYIQSWTGKPSVLLTLIAGIIMIECLREQHISLFIGMGLFVWLSSKMFDYGWRGVALILLFYLFIDKPILSLPCVTAFILWWGISQGNSYELFGITFSMETFAVFALPFIYIHAGKQIRNKMRMPKWFFYTFYPGHMVLIYMLNTFVMK